MPEIWFTAANKMDPSLGEEWASYLAWIQRPQLKESITLDVMSRAGEVQNPSGADWDHNVQQHYRIHYYRDLDYLLERCAGNRKRLNILAACLEPPSDARELFDDPRFEFQGYDLIGYGDISAVTNCTGYDEAFKAAEVSKVNLLEPYAFARQVQERLRDLYPSDEHSACDLWAVWRMIEMRDSTGSTAKY